MTLLPSIGDVWLVANYGLADGVSGGVPLAITALQLWRANQVVALEACETGCLGPPVPIGHAITDWVRLGARHLNLIWNENAANQNRLLLLYKPWPPTSCDGLGDAQDDNPQPPGWTTHLFTNCVTC